MDSDRARLLRQHRQRRLDLGLHRHHEIGELVDDDDDVGNDSSLVLEVLERHFVSLRVLELLPFVDLAVEILDVAGAIGGEQLVAVLHLEHRPLEHGGGVAIVGDDLVPQVRKNIVHRELDHLRIDHQEAQRRRRVTIDEARDQCVDAHRFSGAGRAGDEQVRHLGQIGDDRTALEILAERDRQRRANVLELARLDQLAECHYLGGRIRDFDTNRAPPRNRRDDADALRAHRQRQVVGEIRDLADFDSGGGCDFELRHDGPGGTSDEIALDAESSQRVHELDAHRVQLALPEVGVARRGRRQQRR